VAYLKSGQTQWLRHRRTAAPQGIEPGASLRNLARATRPNAKPHFRNLCNLWLKFFSSSPLEIVAKSIHAASVAQAGNASIRTETLL
jgi:hypothetical protein